ncbi:MAG: 1-deoxy-D-xylulose-5-phosphate reductoisomerase, partial [Hyphomicrobium sp.]
RFPALRLGREALNAGGTAPAVLNAANEVAVEAFLKRAIGFRAITELTAATLEAAAAQGLMGQAGRLSDILAVDAEARRLAQSLLSRYV